MKPNLTLPSSIATVIDLTDYRSEPPRPLVRELPPAEEFPVDALGVILSGAARAINDRVRAPLAICGQAVLAAATLAVQAQADVQLPTGHIKPVSDYFVTVAESGERKTAADTEALRPVKERERQLRKEFDERFPQYQNAMVAWEEARKHAVKEAKGNRSAIKAALDKIGPAPIAPLGAMLTCPEPTFEGLVKYLAVGQPSAGIFSDEGGQFIGGHGMTQEAILRTASGLSCLWDGETIKRVRAADGATILPGRRVASHLMAQPVVAAVMLSDPLLINQGYLSRCLVSAPPSNAGTRTWREPGLNTAETLNAYGNHILAILSRPLPLAVGKNNELSPRALRLSDGARGMWIRFADAIEAQIAPDCALTPIKGLANKLPEHAARLAAVLALIADPETSNVSPELMANGITLAQYYAAEALRLFEAGQINSDLLLAQKLLSWLSSRTEAAISLPDIYQGGPNMIRDKASAARIVGVLEDHGWLKRIEGGADVGGHHRRDAWNIIRS